MRPGDRSFRRQVRFAATAFVEAASIACIGAETGAFPEEEVKTLLLAHRPLFGTIANFDRDVHERMGRSPRAEYLVRGHIEEALSLETLPEIEAHRPLSQAVFQSAWLATRALRDGRRFEALLPALWGYSNEEWSAMRAAAGASIESVLLADDLKAAKIDGLWPLDATVAMVSYLSELGSWVRDLGGFGSEDPNDWNEEALPERPYLALAVARSVAQALVWRLDLTRPPASTRWLDAVRITEEACDTIGIRMLENEAPEGANVRLPWPDGFQAAAHRATNIWNWLSARAIVREGVKSWQRT
jgi:hypothetical protein